MNSKEFSPDIISGNGNGDKKRESGAEMESLRAAAAKLQEEIEILSDEIARTELTLQTVLRGPAALEHGPEIQGVLDAKRKLLNSLLKKQRDILREMQN